MPLVVRLEGREAAEVDPANGTHKIVNVFLVRRQQPLDLVPALFVEVALALLGHEPPFGAAVTVAGVRAPTADRAVAVVATDVPVHVSVRGEMRAADVAAEGPLARVDQHVAVQRAVAAQLLLTEATLEQLEATRVVLDDFVVGADVTREVVLVVPHYVTYIAHESASWHGGLDLGRLYSTVDLQRRDLINNSEYWMKIRKRGIT